MDARSLPAQPHGWSVWHRRRDGGRLRDQPRGQSVGPPRSHQVGTLSGAAGAQDLHSESGWLAAAARYPDAPGIMHLMQFALGMMGEDEPSLRPIFAGVDPH